MANGVETGLPKSQSNPEGTMKRSGSAVKFADAAQSDDAPAAAGVKPNSANKMRYGKLKASKAAEQAADGPKKTFDPSAAPARPAMKTRGQGASSAPLYPDVEEQQEHSSGTQHSTTAPNPATGLVGYQTRGGAALASALGMPDGLTIPPPCPPALPHSVRPQAGAGAGDAGAAFAAGGPTHNPLKVPELPVTAPLVAVAVPAAAAAADTHAGPMPAAAAADGTVQLTTPGYGSSSEDIIKAQQDAGLSGLQRDQLPHKEQEEGAVKDWAHSHQPAEAAAAAGGWGLGHVGAHHQGGSKGDIEAAADADDGSVSPMAAGKAASFDDDASSGVIIPPGSQTPLPPFWSQLTGRAMLVGLLVGCAFLLLTMRLQLASGLAPNLQVVIAGACWVLLRGYTLLLGRDCGCIPALNAQEVSVAAAAALAVASTAAAGGFGSVLLALQDPIAQRVGSSVAGNLPSVVWSLSYGKLLLYLLLVVLSGALLMLAFRKPLFTSPAMTFATGAATGQLLNTLHTPPMSYHGQKQLNRFSQWSVISFLVSGYMWVFNHPACNGFTRFPTLGLQALRYSWNFDFQLSLCGLGIITPLSVAWSLVVGAVLSWGLLWPVLSTQEGSWFPAGLSSWDIRGAYGYHLVTALALLLADAAYHTVRALVTAVLDHRNPDRSQAAAAAATAAAASCAQEASATNSSPPLNPEELGPGLKQKKKKRRFNKNAWKREALRILDSDALSDASSLQFSLAAMERALRQHIFMSDPAWSWVGVVGFVVLSAAAVGALPVLFSTATGAAVGGAVLADARGLQVQYLLVAAPLAAMAAFANSRGGGTVDLNLADAWAKLAVLIFAVWSGSSAAGGVGSSLLCGGVVLGATSSALNAMYAWRAGYMTMTSPTAIFVAFMIGLGVGCVVAPAAWLLFHTSAVSAAAAAAVGAAAPTTAATAGLLATDNFFASPLAAVFRSTAALATGGFSALPHAAPYVGLAALVVGVAVNLVRESLPAWLRGIVPYPAVMGVVFLSGANVAVDVVVGAAIRIFWRMRYPRSAEAYNLAVGCALIAGEGLWGLGKGLLAAFGVAPPICMSFTPAPRP